MSYFVLRRIRMNLFFIPLSLILLYEGEQWTQNSPINKVCFLVKCRKNNLLNYQYREWPFIVSTSKRIKFVCDRCRKKNENKRHRPHISSKSEPISRQQDRIFIKLFVDFCKLTFRYMKIHDEFPNKKVTFLSEVFAF